MSVGSTVHFSGIDIVDGTPILDIKPFIPQYDAPACHSESLTLETNASTTDCSDDDVATDCSNKSTDVTRGRNVNTEANISACRHDDDGIKNEPVLEGSSSSLVKRGEMEDCEFSVSSGESERNDCASPSVGGKNDARETTTDCDLRPQTSVASSEPRLKPGLLCDAGQECSTVDDYHDEKVSKKDGFNNKSVGMVENEKAFHRKRLPEEVVTGYKTTATFKDQGLNGVASPEPDSLGEFPHGVDLEQSHNLSWETKSSDSATVDTSVAQWLTAPPVAKLQVSFTPTASAELQKFATQDVSNTDSNYRLDFLSGKEDIRAAIVSVLSEDPRSVYRRKKCQDALYFFTVDQVHVTCWFDENRAEVVRLQPLSYVEKLAKRS